MPQMNPMPWIMLFTLFITIFILTNCINYFFPNKFNFNFNKKMNIFKSTNWKW